MAIGTDCARQIRRSCAGRRPYNERRLIRTIGCRRGAAPAVTPGTGRLRRRPRAPAHPRSGSQAREGTARAERQAASAHRRGSIQAAPVRLPWSPAVAQEWAADPPSGAEAAPAGRTLQWQGIRIRHEIFLCPFSQREIAHTRKHFVAVRGNLVRRPTQAGPIGRTNASRFNLPRWHRSR